MKAAFYTAIFGDKDELPIIQDYQKSDDFHFLCFTDNKNLKTTYHYLSKYYQRIGNQKITDYFKALSKNQIEKLLFHSFKNRLFLDFCRAYLICFKEFTVYKNPKEFIYLHKTVY